MKQLASAHSNLVTFEASIGTTVEGRAIPLLRITGTGGSGNKKRVWLQSLQHAREWISGATTQYIADQLASGYPSNARIKTILDQIEFVIVPVANPDGYEYTWTTDRYWRKNRGSNGDGVDMNRNWSDHWGTGGSSSDSSSDVYMGTSPASEPEVQALMSTYSSTKDVIAAVDIHSFSQLVLRPYGWTDNNSPDEDAFAQLGEVMKNEIAKPQGTQYTNERIVDLYVASGGSNDWWYGLGTPSGTQKPYGMALELSPADGGEDGFVLDPSNIVPIGGEITGAVLAMCEYALANPLGVQE